MKAKHKFSVVVVPLTPSAPQPHKEPRSREEKLADAIAFLGARHVLSREYQPRVRVGFYLTAWCSELARKRSAI